MALLTLANLATAVLGYILLRTTYRILHNRYFHPLSQFPGPFWASATRLWITWHNVLGQEVDVCERLHKKYGPVIRITPTMLLVSDATKLPLIYHRSADKSSHYISGSLGKTESIFNMQPHAMHAKYRKLAAAPYSFTNIKRMEGLIDVQIGRWIDKLTDTFEKTKREFDFCPWAVYMAYDVVSEVGFGAPFGFIEQGKDVAGLIQGMHDGLLPFGILARLYPFTNWVKKTWVGEKYLVAKPEHENGFGAMMRFRDKLIEKRLEDLKQGKEMGRVDLLQNFIDARDEDGKPLPLDYIKAEILIVLIAGADTTGTAFQAFVQFILKNPAVYAKMMDEIDSATKSGKLSTPVPKHDEVLQHCPYYVACVKEAMRLIPSAPSIYPRLVSKGGVDLDGKFVAEGMELTANPYLVHRDRNIYGEDADEFRPERWLEDEEKAKEYEKYSMTFGYGSRACLGRYVAQMEMYKAPLLFFRTFEIDLCERTHGKARYQVKGGVAFFENMWIRIKKRGN